jgi:hypothetical protein
MAISFGFITRFNRKRVRTVNGNSTLRVNESVVFTGNAHNLTLPTRARLGDVIDITGAGSGVYTIKQGAGQKISHLTSDTTVGTGGSLAAGTVRDCIRLVCVSADGTTWKTNNAQGTFTVV